MKKEQFVHLGFEVGTGEPIGVPLLNMAVTGQTQSSGKTTTLEALAHRSGARVLTFITKRGESSFEGGWRIKPYFRERADWQFVDSLIEVALGEKNRFLRQFLIPLCRTTRTLKEVQEAVRKGLKKAHGAQHGAFVQLDAYLDMIVPDIARAELAPGLKLAVGEPNVMDLSDFSLPMQMLFVQSALDWVNERERDTVVVIPEAWEFIPEGKGSPVKASAIALVRKGSALRNHIWIDSQDMAGVDKTILRGCPVWLIGVQREINEVKRNIANIPPPAGRPKPQDVQMLERGQFFACFGKTLAKVYVQPAWMGEGTAQQFAKSGVAPAQGSIGWPRGWDSKPLPKAAKPLQQDEGDADVKESEARALREENDALKEKVRKLEARIDMLIAEDRINGQDRSERSEETSGDAPTAPRNMNEIVEAVLMRARNDPKLLRILAAKPEIEVRIERKIVTLDGASLKGRVARLLASGFFDTPKTNSAVRRELQRTGSDVNFGNLAREIKGLQTDGFLTAEGDGMQSVEGMKVNLIEA